MTCRTLWIAVIVLVGVGAVQGADKPVVPAKKTMLFNGKDLAGWEAYLEDSKADPKNTWSVSDGVLRCTGTPTGYIQTAVEYADYKLHVEWRWPDGAGNSGVLLHKAGKDMIWPKCIEAQLKNGNAGDFILMGGTNCKEHEGKEGRRMPRAEEDSEKPLGEWNRYDIVCAGGTIEVRINGVLQNKATECTVRSGRICLQSEGRAVEFRNVYVEPVTGAPIVPDKKIVLFNGKDLTGWVPYLRPPKGGEAPDPKNTWSIKDGVIVCQGKPAGYIRTAASYANYKLHVEWRWPDKGGNSGVLVHQSGADKVWPDSLECQLASGNAGDFWVIGAGTDFKEHKGMKGRRKPKSKPSAEKPLGEWNSYDIVCKGGNILPSVNGQLMNTATESTIQSGKICLQSEGRLIEFRNVYVEPVE